MTTAPRAGGDDTANPFAEFVPVGNELWRPSQREMELRLAPSTGDDEAVRLQREIEQDATCQYAHWWCAWELLRRSPRQWDALHAPVSPSTELVPDWQERIDEVGADESLQELVSLQFLPDPSNAQRMIESSLRLGHGATLGRLHAHRFSREHTFPPPTPDLAAPAGAAEHERTLHRFFAPLLQPAVILGRAARLGRWRAPTRDYAEIFVHVDAAAGEVAKSVKLLLARLRRHKTEVRGRWVFRPNAIWGTFSPVEAISFLDARASGEPHRAAIRNIHEQRLKNDPAPEVPASPEPNSADDLENLRVKGYDLADRLLEALRDNPIRPIAHVKTPRSPRRRRSRP